MSKLHKYPVGIQSFERMRSKGYLYVDKTPLIYDLISKGGPYFLSRPRRFGKSLLVSTLAAIFEGRRELFEQFTTEDGICQPQLFIATTDWRWDKHAVIRFDFSAGDLQTIDHLDALIDDTLRTYELQYGITDIAPGTNLRMRHLLRAAHQQTGQGVVVLVDEYDNFILHALGDKEKTDTARQRFQNVFGPLKEMDELLDFVLVTGISKFSQMGIFSKLNQLKNISLRDDYAALCGITEQELTTQLHDDIDLLARHQQTTCEDMLQRLKDRYDGYHFSPALKDLYNPFSLFSALDAAKLEDYWFASGTSSAVIDMLSLMPPIGLSDIDPVVCEAKEFDKAFSSYQTPLPILYQSGYLTIKDYDPEMELYTLGLPNREVSRGFADCLYQFVTHRQNTDDADKSQLLRAFRIFCRDGKMSEFVQAIQSFFAGLPYQLELGKRDEAYYHALLYTLLVAFGADVRAEESTARGRSDIILMTPKGIYVMELKVDRSVEEALRQIIEKGYAEKYRLDGRPVTGVALVFGSNERNITDWKTQPLP